MCPQPLVPLVVDEQQPGTRIVDAIFKLARRPPGVERHDDRPDARRGEEDHRPFGQVAHRQTDPIPLGDTHFPQLAGQRRHRAEIRVIGDAFVLIDGEELDYAGTFAEVLAEFQDEGFGESTVDKEAKGLRGL